MLYALTQKEDSYFADKLERAILMAPCFALTNYGMDYFKALIDTMDELGVKALGNGPNFEEYHLPRICEKNEVACQTAQSMVGAEQMSFKSWHMYLANGMVEKFADYMPEYSTSVPDPIPLVTPGLESIDKVPIILLPSVSDTSCPLW